MEMHFTNQQEKEYEAGLIYIHQGQPMWCVSMVGVSYNCQIYPKKSKILELGTPNFSYVIWRISFLYVYKCAGTHNSLFFILYK